MSELNAKTLKELIDAMLLFLYHPTRISPRDKLIDKLEDIKKDIENKEKKLTDNKSTDNCRSIFDDVLNGYHDLDKISPEDAAIMDEHWRRYFRQLKQYYIDYGDMELPHKRRSILRWVGIF